MQLRAVSEQRRLRLRALQCLAGDAARSPSQLRAIRQARRNRYPGRLRARANAKRRRLIIRATAGAALVSVPSVTPRTGLHAERVLLLEVWINGTSTGLVAEFLERDGAIFAAATELTEIGLTVPAEIAPAEAKAVPMLALPGIRFEIDEVVQRLAITADMASLRPTLLGAAPQGVAPQPNAEARLGAVLNYDLLGTYQGAGRPIGSAFLDLRVSSGWMGAVSSSALVHSQALGPQQEQAVRLETNWTYSEPDELRRWRVGDMITGGLAWTRPVRLGGLQVQTDFGLRPDLVTFPLPVLSGQAAVPSAIDVLLDGARHLSQSVNAGPFELRPRPTVTGAGEVAFALRDALGRETITTLPFYTSSSMMAPGLLSYSVEGGAVRQGFGKRSNDYRGWATSGSARYGLKDWLTVEGHAEVAEGLHLGGVGGVLRIATLGTVSGSVAASGGPKPGFSGTIGFERQSRRLRLGVSLSRATPGFQDIAARQGTPVPRQTLRANLGFSLGRYGSLGFAYVARHEGVDYGYGAASRWPRETRIVTASYNLALSDNVHLYASGFADLAQRRSYGAMVGISMALSGGTTLGGSASLDSGQRSYQSQASRPAISPGDVGLRTAVLEGQTSRRIAEGEYLGSWGRATAGIDQTDNKLTGRLGARGALVLAGGGLFFSDTIQDSFAVVKTGGVGGVDVLHENRSVGKTNAKGRLLVPYLRSYQANNLAIDTTSLPMDVQVGRSQRDVRPPDRSGVVVDFDVRRESAALVRLVDAAGRPVPMGSMALLPHGTAVPVGHGGEVFLTGLEASNRLQVTLPGGASCAASFAYAPMAGELPVIGPVTCR